MRRDGRIGADMPGWVDPIVTWLSLAVLAAILGLIAAS